MTVPADDPGVGSRVALRTIGLAALACAVAFWSAVYLYLTAALVSDVAAFGGSLAVVCAVAAAAGYGSARPDGADGAAGRRSTAGALGLALGVGAAFLALGLVGHRFAFQVLLEPDAYAVVLPAAVARWLLVLSAACVLAALAGAALRDAVERVRSAPAT